MQVKDVDSRKLSLVTFSTMPENVVHVVREELSKFAHHTSVRGVSRLFKAKFTELKIMWTLGVVACMCVGFYQSYTLVGDYLAHTKITQMQKRTLRGEDIANVVFPKIQVCNINPSGMWHNVSPEESYSAYTDAVMNATSCGHGNCSSDELMAQEQLRQELLTPNGYIHFLGPERAKSLLPNISDFLLECTLLPLGKHCSEVANITMELSSTNFMCMYLDFPPAVIALVTMTFYLDNLDSEFSKYNSGYSGFKSSGIDFNLLEPTSRNDRMSISYTSKAPPGTRTSVNVHPEVIQRLESPRNECVEDPSHNYECCVLKCYWNSLRDDCNCVHEVSHSRFEKGSLDYCLILNQSFSQLSQRLKCWKGSEAIATGVCFDVCNHKCNTTEYDVQVSYSKWPLKHQYDSFYQQVIAPRPFAKTFSHLFERNDSYESELERKMVAMEKQQMIEENFVQLEFTYDTFVITEYIEVPQYTLTSLIGTLGGALNLWTGITVFAFIELFEAFLLILKGIFLGNEVTNNSTQTDKDTPIPSIGV